MWICLALLEIACGFAPAFPDQIFADGADMAHISYDRRTTTWSLVSTPNGDAAFVTSSNYLSDGKVAIPARFTWDSGTQSTATYTVIVGDFSSTPMSIAAGDLIVFALLCPNTQYTIPKDALIGFYIVGTFAHSVGSGQIVAFNNGGNGIYLAYTLTTADILAVGSSLTGVQFWLDNTNGSTTWASAGQAVDVGELWFGKLQELKIAGDPKISLLGGPTERRSHSNQPWALQQKSYRQMQTSIVPMSDSSAYSGTNNFEKTRYALAAANSALFIPRLNVRGSSTQDADSLAQLTIFGRPTVAGLGPLVGVKDASGLWTANLSIEEAPP